MKKTSVISLIVISALLIIFALINAQPTLATRTDKNSPQSVIVEFTVTGCSNCDITYCINGGPRKYAGNCVFKEELPAGNYTICLNCPLDKIGTATFVVTDDGSKVLHVPITVRNANGEDCACSDSKKK